MFQLTLWLLNDLGHWLTPRGTRLFMKECRQETRDTLTPSHAQSIGIRYNTYDLLPAEIIYYGKGYLYHEIIINQKENSPLIYTVCFSKQT